MSVIGSNVLAGASGQSAGGGGGGGGGGAAISRSLRFNSGDSAYLGKTFGSGGNSKTWTLSFWVKRAGLGATNCLFMAYNGSSIAEGDYATIQFNSDDTFRVGYAYASYKTTTRVFRDPSAWHHIVVTISTTSSTAGDRVQIYVNGVKETSFSATHDPDQNQDLAWNKASFIHRLGSEYNQFYSNVYLADVHFIDSQALAATDFGETNTDNLWVPKAYAGTYGTNGFRLEFADNSGATATTLGKDTSGGSNNWTPNNLSVSAGAGNDSLFDTPTNGATASDTGSGGQITGCYATLNPLAKSSNFVTTNGNLAIGNSGGVGACLATIAYPKSGKWYYEIVFDTVPGYNHVGIARDDTALTGNPGYDTTRQWTYWQNGLKTNGAAYGNAYVAGDVIGVAFDADAGSLTFYKNGTSQGVNATGLTSTTYNYFPYFPCFTFTANINFGQRAFSHPVSGYKSLNTANLSSTIADGSLYFDTKLWTGNGSARSITGYNFSPDFAWLKKRNSSSYGDHMLFDTVRGATKFLSSHDTGAEGTDASTLTAFTSDGFTIDGGYEVNKSSDTYVGWAWDAGTGANPVGDIWQGSATKYIGVKFASASGGTVSYGQSSGSTTVEVWTSSNNSSWTQQGGTQTLSTGHTLTTSDQYVFIRNTSDATFTNWYAAATNGADGHYSSGTYPSGASWSGPSYTDYDWRADGGTLNNDGDILSIVRANPSAGFSIVSYTGIGGIPKSIGHSLNNVPGLIILKRRDAVDDWPTYFLSHTYFTLNTADNTSNNDQFFHGDYKPTSTLFTIGGNGAVNASGGTYIAYCFASVEGYSKISTFQGNGSTDGTFVYTGFKPRFLLIKRYGTKAWQIIDTARSSFNVTDDRLFPNDSGAESSGSNFNLDILSNGFKCRTAHDSTNAASTYAYYAVAEHPFASNGGLAR